MYLSDPGTNQLPDLARIKFQDDKPAAQKKPFNVFDDLDEDSESEVKSEDNKVIDYNKKFIEQFDSLLD